MAEQEQRNGVAIPWANITALVIAVVGGLTLLFDPLVSSRPQKGSRPLGTTAEQDVDARLWQDPLRVAVEHFEKITDAREIQARSDEKLNGLKTALARGTDASTRESQRILILPVAIPGGPYAENNERRLRTRHAVISGLAASGFTPDDGEHIGYFILPASPAANVITAARSNLAAYLVPFEWFRPRYGDPSLAQPPNIARVLIIWFRDDAPATQWLGRLADLGQRLEWNTGGHIVRVIGPGSSTSLNRILREDGDPGAAAGWKAQLAGVHLFAPMPTASEAVIALQTQKTAGYPVLNAGPTLHRTNNTDDQVAAVLIEELKRRKVDLAGNVQPLEESRKPPQGSKSPGKPPRFQHVAVIGEWDTLYGRSLPLTFLSEIFKAAGHERDLRDFMRNNAGELRSGSEPEWFHSFTYSRGIDGRLPGDSGGDKGKSQSGNESAAARPREGTEGEDQSDYLRRLAGQLAAMHHELKRTGSEGLKAVGVLGSDVYDKLMILRALRKALPGVLFFTNNLDARLGMAEEWRATHNLIVVSPFGPALHEKYQRNIAPFRDSYQTAVFASTLMATEVLPVPKSAADMQPPRIFEIARNGPWDLSVGSRAFDPPRPDTQTWWGNPGRSISAYVMLGAVVALLFWIGITAGWIGLASEPAAQWRWWHVPGAVFANSGAATTIAALTGFAFICWFSDRGDPRGEPFAFMQGVSVWPTEMVRIVVIILCLHFGWKSRRALMRSDREIEREHHLCPPEQRRQPATWGEWFRGLRLRQRLSDAHLGWRTESLQQAPAGDQSETATAPAARVSLQDERRIRAEILWQEYLERGRWSRRWSRFGPLAFFYLLGGVALFVLLGFPTVPAREGWSFQVDLWLLILTVISTTMLLFYVVDAIRLNRDLIELFNQGITVWPESAQLKDPRHRILSKEELSEYLDIRLIAARTEVVCPLVNYPFVTLVLMIVARNSYFDNWEWPLSLIAILALNLGWAIYCSVQLFRAARKARRTAVERLADHRLQALHSVAIAKEAELREQLKTRVKLIEETSAEIASLRRGAFAPLSDQPFFRAILFTSGGIGVGTMLQFLPTLF